MDAQRTRSRCGTDVSYTWSKPVNATSAGTLTGLGLFARTSHGSVGRRAPLRATRRFRRAVRGRDQLLQEVTATGEWRAADGFLARLELRRDFSNQAVFPARDLTTSASQTTLTIGLVWWIGSKKGAW